MPSSEELKKETAAVAASPASFQPRKAQRSAGARRPEGRWSHVSGCIRLTVHHHPMAATSLSPPAARHAHDAAEEERLAIATLRDGREVEAVFACARKERMISRAGSPFLTVELRDRTGTITGRAFRDADLLAGRFDRGDLVRVSGRVRRWGEELQLELRAIDRVEPGELDASAFLPTSYRDLDELEGFLEHLVGEVYDRGLAALLSALLADRALRAEIRRAPCTLPRSAGRPRRRRPSRLPRRAARAHGGGGEHVHRPLRAAPAARPRPPAERGDPPRPRQGARVRLRRGAHAQRGGTACSGTSSWACA